MTKLLIVDDEPLVQIGIKSMLNWTDYGIEICGTAVNGQNALDLIEEYSPEIIITDIRMPIMNGLDLAKACRENTGKSLCLYFSQVMKNFS
ncbi:response regulator [Lacrimispora xylanisolvens]|uniref:response regulator n=1 Tax=Lacrimispora xylanisolvens TaxID=384636 RepID=UPI0024028CB5